MKTEVNPIEFKLDWLPQKTLNQLKSIKTGMDDHVVFHVNTLPNTRSLLFNNMMFI